MKRILLVGCFILLAAAIWFLGPFLGFGEARPLESYEARIICILLALLLILGFGTAHRALSLPPSLPVLRYG
ncbi:hypothetical protein AU082_18735 [Yersinia pestis]|nr:hypothetical protein AU082_18735 [Yersinia pestis]